MDSTRTLISINHILLTSKLGDYSYYAFFDMQLDQLMVKMCQLSKIKRNIARSLDQEE